MPMDLPYNLDPSPHRVTTGMDLKNGDCSESEAKLGPDGTTLERDGDMLHDTLIHSTTLEEEC